MGRSFLRWTRVPSHLKLAARNLHQFGLGQRRRSGVPIVIVRIQVRPPDRLIAEDEVATNACASEDDH